MASFLKELRADTLKDIREIGTACYDANRDILSIYSNPEISIGAISKTEKKNSTRIHLGLSIQNLTGVAFMVQLLNVNFCKERHR